MNIKDKMNIKDNLISEILGGRKLHEFSTINVRKKRFRKKFYKNPYKYLPAKIIALLMCIPPLNYSELGRKLFRTDELPQGAYAKFAKFNLMTKYNRK
jgi:hypothetical protein